MTRNSISPRVQAEVVLKSKRRCAFCVGLLNNHEVRVGQIAHINRNHEDARFENLAWLCLEHHDQYDSTTSVTKNLTEIELRAHRDAIHRLYGGKYSFEEIELIINYLTAYGEIFKYCIDEYTDMAGRIHNFMWSDIVTMLSNWKGSRLHSFNADIRTIQEDISLALVDIINIYDIAMYDWKGEWIVFDNMHFENKLLQDRIIIVKNAIDLLNISVQKLEKIAVY